MCGGSWWGGSAQARLTTLIFLFCPFHDRKRGDYFLSSANENMDLIHREMDWGIGHERLLDFDVSLFASKAFREKLAWCSYRPKHLKHNLCLVCSDQSWERARYLAAKKRKKEEDEEEQQWVTLQVKLWVIVFPDKEANSVELCFCSCLTNAYITRSN